jgi:hypothetical protein
MSDLVVMYRDVDRTPYLFVLRDRARSLGLDLEIVRNQRSVKTGATGEEWGELLQHEEVDFLAENYWGLQSYRLRGVPFVAVAGNTDRWTDMLFARPGITRVADLEGKRMAVRPTGPGAVFPNMWLEDLKMTMELVTIPEKQTGRWGHWKVVASGEFDCCLMSEIYAEPALAAGLHEIPIDYYPFAGGNVSMTTTEHIAATKRDAVQALVDAMFLTNDAFHTDPATVQRIIRDETAELLGEHFTLEPGFEVRFHAMLRDELSELPVPTAAGIHNAQRIRFSTNPELRALNPVLMWDFSFARATLAKRAPAKTLS